MRRNLARGSLEKSHSLQRHADGTRCGVSQGWIVTVAGAECIRAKRDSGCAIHSINMNLLVAKCVVGIAFNPREHKEESAVFLYHQETTIISVQNAHVKNIGLLIRLQT